ncbi:MAG: alpha/beta fold hydrolase [Pseudobacteriovorax sp.]|nr:alpha/beta fold hydrolase [Pseudobacteriovorax sp.]
MSLVYKIVKYPFFSSYQVNWKWPKAYERKSEWQPVKFQSQSKSTLAGLWSNSSSADVKGTIVLGHPLLKSFKGFFLANGFADQLRQAGYHVLVFDFNGFGDSTQGNFLYPKDVIAAGNYASKRIPDIPVYYIGVSFGAGYGLCALSEPNSPYQAAILESPFYSLENYWQFFPVAKKALGFFKVVTPKTYNALSPNVLVKNINEQTKKLVILGSMNDKYSPSNLNQTLADRCNIESEFIEYEDCKHARISSTRPRDYMKIISHAFSEGN